MTKAKRKPEAPMLMMNSEVLRRIRQHARSESKTEVCGVLIGREEDDGNLRIDACISGVNAAQGGSHVTFTQDTWEHIYKIKDKEYPDERILGWYHSHPGFGVFLSDHDTFIHKNFFSAPQQVAWVYDPHSDEEGCFGWVNGRLERLSRLAVADARGGEEAGETGKPEPVLLRSEDFEEKRTEAPPRKADSEPAWLRWTFNILLILSVFACGFMVSWALFPHVVPVAVPVDPRTGLPIDPRTGQLIDPQTGKVIEPPPGDINQTQQQRQQPAANQPPAGKGDDKTRDNGQQRK